VKEEIRAGLFQSVVNYIRKNHEKDIDEAYEYFWEEEDPEEFLGGTALELGFVNFEDWLVCDYRDGGGGSLIDAYMKENEPDEESKAVLESLRDCVIRVYEVVSANGGKTLRDLVLGGEFATGDTALERLDAGDVFATRFVELDGEYVMSRCVYPFNQGAKDTVLEYVDSQYNRYTKNKDPDGTKGRFLKDEAYLFNTIWITTLFKRPKDKA
jgi:hypothetical protein